MAAADNNTPTPAPAPRRITDAIFNIATLGYSSYRRQLQLEAERSKLTSENDRLAGEVKSLRDQNSPSGEVPGSLGSVRLYQSGAPDPTTLFQKRNVRTLRGYAEFSTWVRTGLDIYRDIISQATRQIVPIDPKKQMDKGVKRDLEDLLIKPNSASQTYRELKEMFVEDFLVIGHGALEMLLLRDLTPYGLLPIDAARLAFVRDWDGTSKKQPRYALMNGSGEVVRTLANQQVFLLKNRPRSYDQLGLSHIESLDMAVRGLLNGDDYLLSQVLNPSPGGMLNLGKGANQQQVDELRAQIDQVKKAFAIIGGVEGASYTAFTGSPDQAKVLDATTWFGRQVAAVFKLPTTSFALSVDTSRANTEALLSNANEGPGAVLWKIQEAENMQIVGAYGDPAKHNCMIEYAAFNQRDELQTAQIVQIQVGSMPTKTLNEGRRDEGLSPLPFKAADEILIQDTKLGTIPLSSIEARYYDEKGNPVQPQEQEASENQPGDQANPNDGTADSDKGDNDEGDNNQPTPNQEETNNSGSDSDKNDN